MTEIETIAKGLSPDERELIKCAGFAGISFYSGPLHQLNGKELVHLDVTKAANGNLQKFSAKHTPLGQAVRDYLKGQPC